MTRNLDRTATPDDWQRIQDEHLIVRGIGFDHTHPGEIHVQRGHEHAYGATLKLALDRMPPIAKPA